MITYQCVILIVWSNNYNDTIFIIHQRLCVRPKCLDVSLRQLHTREWNINAAQNSASFEPVKIKIKNYQFQK